MPCNIHSRTPISEQFNFVLVQDLTKKKFNSHETGAASSTPANTLVLATPDHRDSLRALYIWRDCAARMFDCNPRFVFCCPGFVWGLGMAKSIILCSYLIPRRLLLSLANLSSSASPEAGRGLNLIFMNGIFRYLLRLTHIPCSRRHTSRALFRPRFLALTR